MLKEKVTAILVDQSVDELEKLERVLKKNQDISLLAKTTCARHGLALIANYVPQLVFIQVNLAGITGFEMARMLRSKSCSPEIIFLADDDSRVFDALEFKPLDFFIKPVARQEVGEMLERLKLKMKRQSLERKMGEFEKEFKGRTKRVFRKKNGIAVLSPGEIVFCKAHLTKTRLILTSGEEILVSSGVNETMELINSDYFLKVSRSYWINRHFLRKIDKRLKKCDLFFKGFSWQIPVSRSSINMLESFLTDRVY